MHVPFLKQALVIVGAGPAGLAPLLAAARAGNLEALLELGVTVLERTDEVGSGNLGQYDISSDSTAESLLDIVCQSRAAKLKELQNHPLTLELASLGQKSAPLALVAAYLGLVGQTLCNLVAESRTGRVVTGATALHAQQMPRGTWRVYFILPNGDFNMVEAQSVVLSTGACQSMGRLCSAWVAGTPLMQFKGKLLSSDTALTRDGWASLAEQLRTKQTPKFAIVGGSTSAAAVAVKALHEPNLQFGAEAITLLHRGPLRIFYESEQHALADGYTEYSNKDVCTLTGRVFRFAGFRLDSRDMMLHARQIAGRKPDPRLRLLAITAKTESQVQQVLHSADLIVGALGYRPRLLPVYSPEMKVLPLFDPQGSAWSVVDSNSRVLTAEGKPLPGLYAIGLAVGPGALPKFGGEAGFQGQVNSLWMWQHVIGQGIAEQVLHAASDMVEATPQQASFLPTLLPQPDQPSTWAGAA